MSVIRPFTHKAFYSQKVNAVHSLTHYVRDTPVIRYVQQMSIALFSGKGRGFWLERLSLFRKILDLFPVGSKLSPFLYVLTVFLQMNAHDILHKTWKVAAPVAQSADDEVCTLLCRPTQINRLSVVQFGRNKEGLFVGFERSPSHLGTDAPLNGCILCVQCRLGSYYFLAICFLWWSFCLWLFFHLIFLSQVRWKTFPFCSFITFLSVHVERFFYGLVYLLSACFHLFHCSIVF